MTTYQRMKSQLAALDKEIKEYIRSATLILRKAQKAANKSDKIKNKILYYKPLPKV